MLRDDVTSLVLLRLAARVDSSGKLTPAIQTELQLAQTELEGGLFMPWFLEQDTPNWAATSVGNLFPLPLPADFLRPMEFMLFWYNPNNVFTNPATGQQVANPWVNIIRDTDFGVINARWTGLGPPQKYYMTGASAVVLYPPSDQVYQLRLRYWKAQPVLASNIENNWTKWAPDLMAAKAGYNVASKVLKDVELTQAFAVDVKAAQLRLQTLNEAREHADANYEMGDN